MARRLVWVLVASVAIAGCAHAPHFARAADPSWEFVVDVPPEGSHLLNVQATFARAGGGHLAIADDARPSVRELAVHDGKSWTAVRPASNGWDVDECASLCTVRYSIDLLALARSCGNEIDCGFRTGASTLSPASVWLLHPEPAGDATASVRVRGGLPQLFATGLRRAAPDARDAYTFHASELSEGSFTAFGGLRRTRVEGLGATIDVATLDAPLALSEEELRQWVTEASGAIAKLVGRFPVDATVFVIPIHGPDRPVFGRVYSLAGASLAILVGDEMQAAKAHEDWIMVHELFHLVFPSFRGEGHWLEEGLATYYEPILRTRAGWIRPSELWEHFLTEMPRGVRPPGSEAAIEERGDIDSTYWGGALFCFLADVRIRAETHNKHSLDEIIRAISERGGNATTVWRLADVVRVGDEITGTGVLREIFDSFALRGEPVDLATELGKLGVTRDARGHVVLNAQAPLAYLREGIDGSSP